MKYRLRMVLPVPIALLGLLAGIVPAAASGAPPVDRAHVLVHFDLAAKQTPENIATEPDGSLDLTFSRAAQVARVSPGGRLRILAQLPTTPSGVCPVVRVSNATFGIVLDHTGTRYVVFCAGLADLQGVWRVRPGGQPTRLIALPSNGFPNGMALDEESGTLYIADSVLGVIWRASVRGGPASVWASGAALAPVARLGANGIKVHDDAVWASNTDQGTLLRIPIRRNGSAGPIQVRATGLTGIDDFVFTGAGDTVLAARNALSQAVLVEPDGRQQVVLTAADGLSNPTSAAVRGGRLYVASAAYATQTDPNLLVAHLRRW